MNPEVAHIQSTKKTASASSPAVTDTARFSQKATQEFPISVAPLAKASTETFRSDINALRAWAVWVVVCYHLELDGFSSGFVGVDIFFVISGYLITGQVLTQLDSKTFTLARFWQARLRRIFPALCAVIVASTAIGWWLTLPAEFLKHARQSLYAFTFSSNLAFDKERGYFDLAAKTKPLLHTWSLSIEWQFYIILPLVMMAVWTLTTAANKRWRLLAVLAGLAMASLLWSLWTAFTAPEQGFFSLRSRAWEFLAGSVIAYLHFFGGQATVSCGTTQKVLVGSGWLLVIGASCAGLSPDSWPGPLTLIPVVGASLVLWAGFTKSQRRNPLIDNSLVQQLGNWSYSVYLWHWPLWVFASQWASYRGFTIALPHKILLLAFSILAGYTSYRYIEQPVRLNRHYWTSKRLWWTYILTLLALLIFTLAAIKTRGFIHRIPEYQQRAELAIRTNTPRDECFRDTDSVKSEKSQFCVFAGQPNLSMPQSMLWGDSLANQYLEPITSAARELNISGLIATQSACRPLVIEQPGADLSFRGCERFNQEVLTYLEKNPEPKIIIMGRNWGDSAGSAEEAFAVVKRLLAANKTVVLILPQIHPGFNVSEHWMQQQSQAGKGIDDISIPITSKVKLQILRDEIQRQMQHLGSRAENLILIDPLPKVCDQTICHLVRNGQSNFRDTIHISNLNAMQYQDLFLEGLRKAINVSQSRK